MSTFTFPLKYRRKSSPPPSPRMLSPIAPFSSVSPQSKWLDSDDDFDHEPALTSDDALTVFSSSCSRAPSLAPLDAEDAHVDIVSSPVRETFFRPHPSRAPLSRYNKPYSTMPKPSTTREDVAAALLSLHAQPRLGPSRPGLAQIPTLTEAPPPPPARRSRVVTPSLRNLVLPRTPSPPPRPSLPLTIPNQLIDHGSVHAPPPPAQRTPSRRATPASSPLPPSSPFAEEADSEASDPTTFHFVPCPKPKLELFQAHTPPDHSETDNRVPPWSRDDQSKEACNILPSAEHEVPPATSYELSPLTEAAPNPDERHLANEHHSCAPPLPPPVMESSPALSPKSADLREILLPINGTRQNHGSRPETPVSAALSSPVQAPEALPGALFPGTANKDTPTISSSYSRAASSALTSLDDEHSTPPSPPRDRCPASSPLTSPPSSPLPSQWCGAEPRLTAAAGTKRRTSTPLSESDPAAPSALPGLPRSHTKRRRKDADSDNKSWRSRKKQSPASAPAPQPSPPASVRPPILASSSRPSSSSSSTATSTSDSDSTHIDTTATATTSPTTDTTPDGPDDTNDTKLSTAGGHDDDDDQPCPHPALLGTLIEALALSRASSLPLSTLTRTNPALAGYPHAALTSTLAWAVRSRILGCVRSSGEALPPSYFYDPAADPDRERGELLRCLMPRAGKRRETMKYKQYYWAPVVVGRGRTRTWDVDWEE